MNSQNRVLYVCWFSGLNSMSKNRSEALKCLYQNSGVTVELVTNKSFYKKYNNPEIPIHPAFDYLSDVHKSAYFRSYMMYSYGGGYSDIKANYFDWNKYFDELYSSKYDAIGYSEISPKHIVNFWEDDLCIKQNVEKNYSKFAGNGMYIYKTKTEIAKRWIGRVHEELDNKLESLKDYPGTYHPYAIPGGIQSHSIDGMPYSDSKYPIGWGEINGKIIQKLQYENNFSNFLLTMPYINTESYR
jgi:hypothetical protein